MNKRIENQINAIGLKMELEELEKNIVNAVAKLNVELSIFNLLYNDEKLKNVLIEKQSDLLKLINHVNDIENKAYAFNEHKMVYKCEELKIDVRDIMEIIRNKYMF